MNISELSRKLKVTTNELLDRLPQLGFDIGRRAIKVDEKIAGKIVEAWKAQEKRQREMSRISEIRGEAKKEESAAAIQEKKDISLPPVITVRDFAGLLNLPVNKVLAELMKNGVLASMNERIDFDTAAIVGEELGFKILADVSQSEDTAISGQENLLKALQKKDGLVSRPPVVVVMGHVDHGKTKILDAIRKTDVVSQESGGITQHIGAYQVKKNDRLITFIDTPGHEAFTAMRSRGARIADVAILVIAADDSIQPQTKEALKIIQDAKLPFIVAINKIDKSEANAEKVKQDLSSIGLLPEDWGGQTICSLVSAKTGQGIDDLLDTVLLLADLEKDRITAVASQSAIGTIIESHLDKGEGPVATILVQVGTLKVGELLAWGSAYAGKVRALKDYKGDPVSQVAPGTPARILGLKVLPSVGSILEVVSETKDLNKNFKQQRNRQEKDYFLHTASGEEDDQTKAINLIVRGDVLGSVEAIIESLIKLETADIKIKIVGKGLGSITEADVMKAEATGAQVLGFRVKPSVTVANLARDKQVAIKTYDVIYHLIEDIQKEIAAIKEKEVVRKMIGQLEVLKVFRRDSNQMIVGGRVVDGGIAVCELVIVTRAGEAITSGRVSRIECSRQLADKVASGQECGLTFEGKPVIEAGDVLEFYQETK